MDIILFKFILFIFFLNTEKIITFCEKLMKLLYTGSNIFFFEKYVSINFFLKKNIKVKKKHY